MTRTAAGWKVKEEPCVPNITRAEFFGNIENGHEYIRRVEMEQPVPVNPNGYDHIRVVFDTYLSEYRERRSFILVYCDGVPFMQGSMVCNFLISSQSFV